MATTREELRALVDTLPDDLLDEVRDAISAIADAPYRPLSEAPEDDEPLTDEEIAALDEGHEEYLRGETISGDAIRREFGR